MCREESKQLIKTKTERGRRAQRRIREAKESLCQADVEAILSTMSLVDLVIFKSQPRTTNRMNYYVMVTSQRTRNVLGEDD